MKLAWIVAVLCGWAALASAEESAPAADVVVAGAGERVVICPITGMIGDGSLVLLKRAVAEAEGAKALVLMINTPGGLLDAAIEMTEVLRNAPCPTVAYVHGMGAISAGALIAYACDDIVMTRGTSIGASTPVTMGGEMPAEIGEKTKSFLRSKYRSLGEEKGHDPHIGEAMVDAKIILHGYRDAEGKYRIVRMHGGEGPAVANTAPEETEPQRPLTNPADPNALEREVVERVIEVAKQVLPAVLPDAAPESPATGYSDAEHPFPTLPDGAEVIDSGTELLTLTTDEAERVGLTTGTVIGIDDALQLFELHGAERAYISPTTAERFYTWLTGPMISGLLLMLGLAGIYWEIKTPGFGFPGVLGIVCLGLFFGSHLVLGLAEWVDVLLVVVGLGLILVEIFLLPGTTAAGIAGFFCVAAGVYLAMTRVPIPQYSFEYERLGGVMTSSSVTLFSMLLFLAATWKILPRTGLPRLFVQGATESAEAGYVSQSPAENAYLGATGTTLTMLRPAGRARIDGRPVDVVTQGEFIEPGVEILVMKVDGNRIVVRQQSENRGAA